MAGVSPISRLSRRLGVLAGGLVADAASLPCHWVYDREKLTQHLTSTGSPLAFSPVSLCPFYQLPLGENTMYGDQSFATLQYLAHATSLSEPGSKQIVVDKTALGQVFLEIFGDLVRYGPNPSGWNRGDPPVQHGWRTKSIREFLQGAELTDDQADSLPRCAPLAAYFPDHISLDEIKSQVHIVYSLTQHGEKPWVSGLFSTLLLHHIIQGTSDLSEAIAQTRSDLADLISPELGAELDALVRQESIDADHADIVKKYGASCSLYNTLINSLHCALKYPHDFEKAINETIHASGDCASRAAYIGALLGAINGVDAIPQSWIKQTHRISQLKELVPSAKL